MKSASTKKIEIIWLTFVILFYLLYNFPGIPPYGDPVKALWHGALTIIPLWIIIYAGLFLLLKRRKLKETTQKTKGRN